MGTRILIIQQEETMGVKKSKRILSSSIMAILLCVVMIFGSLTVRAVGNNSEVTKDETSYDIAVVFDNSGSMYKDGERNRWSYAKYSLGIFASMLDYNKDKLTIFPMWKITSNSTKSGLSDRLDITSSSDVNKIRYIYTPNPDYTPIDVCNRAGNYLSGSSKDEKWLVILTDGGFTELNSNNSLDVLSDGTVKNTIKSFKKDGIKVHFLSFGESAKLYDIADNENIFNNKARNAEDLQNKLIDICNSIFQRNELSERFFDPKTGDINLEVSSNYLFVFTQGKSNKINLVDDKGNQFQPSQSIKISTDNDEKYSAGESPGKSINYNKKVREYKSKLPKLSGSIVTFKNCPKGKYKLGGISDKVQVFYEPDVYVDIALKKDGKRLSQSDLDKGLNPEEYELEYALYDSTTKKPVPKEANLGENLNAYINNEDKAYKSGEKIKLNPESNLDIEVKGDYLNGKYKISSNDNGNINLMGIKVLSEKDYYKVKVDVKQADGLYTLMEHGGWKPIKVSVTRDGKKLSEEELKDLKISMSEKIPFSKKMLVKDSAYEIEIGKNKKGEYIAPQCGDYTITASIKHADEYGREMTGSDSATIAVTPLPAWLIWLIWIIIIAAIIALIIFILNLPAWPARMVCVIEKPEKAKGRISISPSGGTMRIVPFKRELSATVKKNSKLKDKFSKNASVKVISVIPNKKIQSYSIGQKTYTKENKFLDDSGKPFQDVIRNGTQISMTFTSSDPLSAKIKVN